MITAISRMSFGLLCLLLITSSYAGDEGVYGPAAPPDSAFVRVFNATTQSELEARIGGEVISDIAAYGASDFVFLPPGQHTMAIGSVSETLTLKRNRYYTAVLNAKGIRLLENERYSNRLKALVILYNLVDGSTLSLHTGDGKTPVIQGVASNNFGTREVNAVRVGLALFDGAKRVAEVKPVNLERGRAFSLFVAGSREQPVLSWAVN